MVSVISMEWLEFRVCVAQILLTCAHLLLNSDFLDGLAFVVLSAWFRISSNAFFLVVFGTRFVRDFPIRATRGRVRE